MTTSVVPKIPVLTCGWRLTTSIDYQTLIFTVTRVSDSAKFPSSVVRPAQVLVTSNKQCPFSAVQNVDSRGQVVLPTVDTVQILCSV